MTTIENDNWVAELAAQVGAEVERLVEPAPALTTILPDRHTLLKAIEVRKHMDELYGKKPQNIFPCTEDVFIGDLASETKVESLSHLKKVVNEVKQIVIHEDYVGEEAYLSAKLSGNYVGRVREVRLKDLTENQLKLVRVHNQKGIISLYMEGTSFFTDEPFGVLSGDEVDKLYGRIYFKIDKKSGMLMSISVGVEPSALPVQDLEHEYVQIRRAV